MNYKSASNSARLTILLPAIVKKGLEKRSKASGLTLSDYLRGLFAEHCADDLTPTKPHLVADPTANETKSTWQAFMVVNGRHRTFLGAFESRELAELAYNEAVAAVRASKAREQDRQAARGKGADIPAPNFAIGCGTSCTPLVITSDIYEAIDDPI